MKILLLGATGSVGRLIASQALARGYSVTALMRGGGILRSEAADRGAVTVIAGDALDPVAVERAVAGQDAVVYALGEARLWQSTTLFSQTTRILIHAMEKAGVSRLVAITGVGAGDSRGHGGFFYDRIVFPLITKFAYADKDRQEALIRQSGLDWVIVRPAPFTDGPLGGHLRALTDLAGVTMKAVSRPDVAAFVLDQLTGDDFLRRTPLIGY